MDARPGAAAHGLGHPVESLDHLSQVWQDFVGVLDGVHVAQEGPNGVLHLGHDRQQQTLDRRR